MSISVQRCKHWMLAVGSESKRSWPGRGTPFNKFRNLHKSPRTNILLHETLSSPHVISPICFSALSMKAWIMDRLGAWSSATLCLSSPHCSTLIPPFILAAHLVQVHSATFEHNMDDPARFPWVEKPALAAAYWHSHIWRMPFVAALADEDSGWFCCGNANLFISIVAKLGLQ